MYYFGLILVGVIWGSTNCFIEKGVSIIDDKSETKGMLRFLKLASRPYVFLPYLIN